MDVTCGSAAFYEWKKQQEDRSRWIPVSERMPRMGERVMIAHAVDKWIDVGERDIIGSYEYWSDDGEELNQPTHWMALPEPPEVK